jgi:hypothetical protein
VRKESTKDAILYLLICLIWLNNLWQRKVRFTRYDIRCTMCDIRCAIYDVRCTMYDVRYTRYEVRYTMYDLRYTMYDVRYTIYDIRYTIYEVRFTRYDLRGTIYDIRFTSYDVRSWILKLLIENPTYIYIGIKLIFHRNHKSINWLHFIISKIRSILGICGREKLNHKVRKESTKDAILYLLICLIWLNNLWQRKVRFRIYELRYTIYEVEFWSWILKLIFEVAFWKSMAEKLTK